MLAYMPLMSERPERVRERVREKTRETAGEIFDDEIWEYATRAIFEGLLRCEMNLRFLFA